MIEVLDIKDVEETESKKLDITLELALVAYNTLIQFCRQQNINITEAHCDCIFDGKCPAAARGVPADWEEIHYPKLIDNSVFYLKDGKVKQITYGTRQEAEEAFKEMMKR